MGWRDFAIPDSTAAPADASRATATPRESYPVGPQLARFGVNMIPPVTSGIFGVGGLVAGAPLGPVGSGTVGGIGALAGQKYGEHLRNQLAPMVGLEPSPIVPSPWDALTFAGGMAGPPLAASAPGASRGLMEHALKPTAAELKRMPDLVEAALARGERIGARGAEVRASTAATAAKPEISTGRAAALQDVATQAGNERAAAAQASRGFRAANPMRVSMAEIAEDWIATERRRVRLAGGRWTRQDHTRAVGEVREAVRELLGGRRSPTTLDEEGLDYVRQQARDAVKDIKNNAAAGKYNVRPNLLNDIEARARRLLYGSNAPLQQSRRTESIKRSVNEAALSGNSRRLARLAAQGDPTAAAGLVPPGAGPLEREAILSGRLLSAGQRGLPWQEQIGLPLATGGAEFYAHHNPLAALGTAAATRAAMSPRVQSQAALWMNSPQMQEFIRYAPLAARSLGQLAFPPPDTTGTP